MRKVAARRLREAFAFFAPDYAALADLRQRGYGEITLAHRSAASEARRLPDRSNWGWR